MRYPIVGGDRRRCLLSARVDVESPETEEVGGGGGGSSSGESVVLVWWW